MVSRTHVVFRADDRSYFAILKKEIHTLAVSAGFGSHKVGEIDIIVAEMVSNLVKHAGGGQILVKLVEENGMQGIEIISLDNGKGMTDVGRMVTDGVSTKNTLGQGLGAIKRMSQLFQVFSQKDWGTIVLARVFAEDLPLHRKLPFAEVRSVILPKPGEQACGDGFQCVSTPDHIKLFLGDGLGHGPEAAKAVEKAIEAFQACQHNNPVEIIRHINEEVKKTRGLVATVAVFNVKAGTWEICGVGNIATKVISPGFSKAYMSYNGIVGLNLPRTLNTQHIPHEKGQVLVMCSDGLRSRWEALRFPSVLRYDLSVFSTSLINEFARYTDDMSVMACKING
jgi:anti-sigma regulatory factor (Ser/Thr protein kinase)